MMTEMDIFGGGDKSFFDKSYSLITTGLAPNVSRCTIKDGGYFIKSGVCFFDITLDLAFTSAGNSAYLTGMPTPTANNQYLASDNGSKWVAQTGNYLTSLDTIPQTGDTIRIIGAYPTSAT
jgi:hypothetical protein